MLLILVPIVKGCIFILSKTNKGFIILSTTFFLMIFISVTMLTISINKSKTDLNVEEIDLISLKIELEAFALNFVANKNIARQVSSEYKDKSELKYRIDNYQGNYVIYVYNQNYQELKYYMIFNNPRSNPNCSKTTIFKEGYIEGANNELEG